MTERTIAIGDIHGCSHALAALIKAICPTAEDTLVTLGDYIDRGPDSKGVLEQLLSLKGRCRLVPLMGNHEDMLLEALGSRSTCNFWLACGGAETLDSYGPRSSLDDIPGAHLRFIEDCKDFYEIETHIFLHAYYLAHLPLVQQPQQVIRWSALHDQSLVPHCSGKIAMVGHTSQMSGEILDVGFLKCIDTYCHGGGWLTGYDVTNGRIWQTNERGELRNQGNP
jgi:serine/threonine protein phosphatase 1